jgi:hypothetical protein
MRECGTWTEGATAPWIGAMTMPRTMRAPRRRAILVILLLALAIAPRARAADWLPISAEELAMTSEPAAPNAPAIYLYRQVDRDDQFSREIEYRRIKILSEEGLKYADVRIEFYRGRDYISSIEARVIHPDGRIAKFDGTVYEQALVKVRGVGWFVKTLTLPDVQVGCIIEYSYRRSLPENVVYGSRWLLSADLFTKRANFSLVKYPYLSLKWSWPLGLPQGATEPVSKRGSIRLEAHDIPAFVSEDFEPPESALKMRVDFVYSQDSTPEKEPAAFWKHWGKDQYRAVTHFVDRRAAMEKAVATIVAPADPPEVRLRKIYDRVQRVRNRTFEPEKTEEEIKRENIKSNSDVEDVWTRGYGNGIQLTWLFLALVRAAGIEADPVWVSSRNEYFFQPGMMDESQLNTNVVRVRLDGKETYFDPGAALTPYGVLPWQETAVKGLCLDKDGGTWIATPSPPASDSTIERKAVLQLDERGSLEGKLTVIYTGQEALSRRLAERDADDTSRKQYLESEVKNAIPSGIDVDLTNNPDWKSASPTLTAEFDLKVPGWATRAGSRALLRSALFGATEKHVFEHNTRIHPLYISYTNQQVDDVEITMPPKFKVSNVPKAYDVDLTAVAYKNRVEENAGKLRLRREVVARYLFLSVSKYGAIHDFYQQVRAGDGEQIVLSTIPGGAAH